MKLIIIQTQPAENFSEDYLINNIQIADYKTFDIEKVVNFFRNHTVNMNGINLEHSFIAYIPGQDSNDKIVGLLSFEKNLVPTKFFNISEEERAQDNRNFNEITHIVIDEVLLNPTVLQRCLMVILPELLTNTPVDEVVWCDYKNELWSRVTNAFVKQLNGEYYFANEADYFANKIINAVQCDRKHERIIKDFMQQA